MSYNFDEIIDRRNSTSIKWNLYDEGVIPMWVADMDFRVPQAVVEALQAEVAHGVFGYGASGAQLSEIICQRLATRYNWQVQPDEVVLVPGVVSGFNIATRAVSQPGNGVLIQPPVYYPMLMVPDNHNLVSNLAPLTLTEKDNHPYYEIDFEAFEAAITPQTSIFLLCSPHNPVGRSFSREELTRMAEICARHDVVICSDEIHCELMMDGNPHLPTAAISPEISQNTITLMAPSKTFNVPGLGCSFAVIQNADLRQKFNQAMAGLVPHVRSMGVTAAIAAFQHGDDWLEAMLQYLTDNRNYVAEYVQENLPGIKTTLPEATYLAWLDCREANIEGDPYNFFLKHARVAFSQGADFGTGGEGFIRLNYGCPRATLTEALERVRQALVNH